MPNKYSHNGDNSVMIRVTKDLKECIQQAAASENRSMSNYIVNLILKDLNEKNYSI